MKTLRLTGWILLVGLVLPGTAFAQEKIAYIDSDYILEKIPEYATVQQQIDKLITEWQDEMRTKQEAVDLAFQSYQARELLYTEDERRREQERIMRLEQEIEEYRNRQFGPEGELFNQQDILMRPIQERILVAVEELAVEEGYDYVFDKSGDFLFLYAREQYDLSDQVLEKLGIDLGNAQGR